MEIPRYCKDCKSFDTFEWYPAGDIYGEPGTGNDILMEGSSKTIVVTKLMWKCYRCTICGHKTLRRIKNG